MSLVPIYQEASGFRMIHQTLLSEFVDVAPLSKLHNSAGTLLIGDSNAPFNACQVVSNIWYLILYPQLSGPQKKHLWGRIARCVCAVPALCTKFVQDHARPA